MSEGVCKFIPRPEGHVEKNKFWGGINSRPYER
jgi:hypothetical protein